MLFTDWRGYYNYCQLILRLFFLLPNSPCCSRCAICCPLLGVLSGYRADKMEMQGSQSIGRKVTQGMSLKTKPRASSVRTKTGLLSRLWTVLLPFYHNQGTPNNLYNFTFTRTLSDINYRGKKEDSNVYIYDFLSSGTCRTSKVLTTPSYINILTVPRKAQSHLVPWEEVSQQSNKGQSSSTGWRGGKTLSVQG